MTPLFAQIGNLFSSHWGVVLVVGLLFFALQLTLCIRYVRRITRLERILRDLYRDFQEGGDGRDGTAGYGAGFRWLEWVLENFPAGSTTPGNYTRDDVLQELDTRIASSSDYLLLQRMGVMAPLLGVILTVLGFFWLDDPKAELSSLSTILGAVTPLVSGVGTGAVLALINQGLLHLAGGKAESIRMTARTWFDAVIWSHVGLDTQAATVKSIAAIEKMAKSISDSADRQQDNTGRLVATTTAIEQAATIFRSSAEGFGGSLHDLPITLANLQVSMRDTANALQQLIPVGQRAVAGLDVSVSAFRTTVEQQFMEAARLHRNVIEGLSESVSQIEQSTGQLRAGATQLRDTVHTHGQSFQKLQHSLEGEVLPAHASFHATADELGQRMLAFRSMLEILSNSITAVAREFSKVAGQLEPAVVSFRAAVDGQFMTAASQHRQNLEVLAASVNRIQQASQTLEQGATSVGGLLEEHARAGRQVGPAQDALRVAMEKVATLGERITSVVDRELTPSHERLRMAAEGFGESADQLAAFVRDGLGPATRQLAELDQTLLRLNASVDALHELPKLMPDLDQLLKSLAEAATVAEAIRDLPQQVRVVLEQTIAAQPNGPAGGPDRAQGWFRRKMRLK